MYRCKECQTEYEIKPDYCDCGNDTFEEILPEPVKSEPAPIPKSEPNIPKEIPPKQVQPQPQPQPQPQQQPHPQQKVKPSIDMPSLIIFLFCVTMAFIVIFFVGNPKDTEEIKTSKQTKSTTDIPNLNTFWNNALPKTEPLKVVQQPPQEVIKPQPVVPQPVQQVIPQQQKKKESITSVFVPQKTIQKSQVKQSTQPKATTTQTKKTQQPSTQQPQTTIQQKTTQVTPQPAQPKVTTTQQPTQTKTVNKQELASYKLGLRNVLANRMNFANVIGDGSCVVTFKISSSGALLNKRFAQQSDNFTLNDVVYNAVMQVNSYNPPPSGYRSETLRLTVKMYNGNFSVSLN